MPYRDIVVIGASAGGVEALTQLVAPLPIDLPATLLLVVHLSATAYSALPQILSRAGPLPALHPQDQQPLQPGQIYIAPPNVHLFLRSGRIGLSRGPRENGFRPAVDVLFYSAAQVYTQRVIGIILSGALDDGTAGLAMIKAHGGVALVQDPLEAAFGGMPGSAIANVQVDHILKVRDLASCLEKLVHETVTEEPVMSNFKLESEAEIVAQDKANLEAGQRPGQPSPLTCPGCGGVLWELRDGDIVRFRCHVGHAYSIESLQDEQRNSVEVALWSAVRALEEKAALSRRMMVKFRAQNSPISALHFQERAQQAENQAELVRQVLAAQQNGRSQPVMQE
uniref:protein-glutamate methylesterase n=1 Tax=Cyanothece sp. (strain PCC 7425 / ATCC 29141) TaxID=395961 RepID=B8HMX8_CYAP4